MKYPFLLFILIACAACNNASNKKSTKENSKTDSLANPDTTKTTIAVQNNLRDANKAVLLSIKNKDYQSLAQYIDPKIGIRLTPYSPVNTLKDITIEKSSFIKTMSDNKMLLWGQYDGTGYPIELTPIEYFDKFVYDVDFLNAEKVSINQFLAKGNSINNIITAYAGYDYVENYFSGFNKELGGIDWKALILVFKKDGDQYYLIGIVHDQWTI